ncbi:MAG: tail fiber domain-containing protein [Bacteroidales bacterium]
MKNLIIVALGILAMFSHFELYSQEENLEKSIKSDPNVPIFEIKNDAGQTVFAVYPGGVKIFIDDKLKATGGGFTVGRLGTGKANSTDFLIVNPGDVRVNIEDPLKATGGGFTVGRLGTGKAEGDLNFLNVTADSTRIYTSQTSDKGFAVGNLGESNGVENFMKLNKSNYFIGHNSGEKTTGLYNLFLGYESGVENSTGTNNTFLGYQAGYLNTIGADNVFIGQSAGYSNISGSNNSFLGYNAGYSNSNGTYNAFFGDGAGYLNTSGNYNTLIGYHAGYNTGASGYNTAVGYESGLSLTSWQGGVFVGFEAGRMITGRGNTALGASSGNYATSGEYNVFIGSLAGGRNDQQSLNGGSRNVFVGRQAGYFFGDGNDNVAIGYLAGSNNTGSGNILIGTSAGSGVVTNNSLYIDNSSTSTPLIYGDFSLRRLSFNGNVGVNRNSYSNVSLAVSPNGLNYGIYVDAGSTLYAALFNGDIRVNSTTYTSDIRYKTNIEDFKNGLEKVLQIQGVMFDWNKSKYPKNGFSDTRQIGFIAQNIEKVLPELVEEDAEGMKSVDYSKITVVLVEAVKEQQNQIESMVSENAKLNLRVKELENQNNQLSAEISKLKELKSEIEELKTLVNGIKGKQ